MEGATSGSGLPRPSGIPRLPRPGKSQIPNKPQIPQAPSKYSLNIPRTRPRAHQTKNEIPANQLNPEGQDGQEAEYTASTPEKVNRGFTQNPQIREISLDPVKIDDGRRIRNPGEPAGRRSVVPRLSRMSLLDRTVETLSQIPPSPSPRRRKSNFYPSEIQTSSFSRPVSSLAQSRPPSRPATSTGQYPPIFSTPRRPSPTKHQNETMIGSNLVNPLSNRRSISSFVPRSVPRSKTGTFATADTTPSKPPPVPKLSNDLVAKWSTHSQEETVLRNGGTLFGVRPNPALKSSQTAARSSVPNHTSKSKTYAPKTIKQRPPVASIFSQSPPQAAQDPKRSVIAAPKKVPRILPVKLAEASSTYSTPTNPSPTLGSSNDPALSISAQSSPKDSRKSSAALRETIAKAKAARRSALKDQPSLSSENLVVIKSNAVEDTGFFGDAVEAGKVLRKRIETARTTGKLNISALGLRKFPEEINDMYNLEKIEPDQGEWYESVDLIRLIAADNELDILDDWAFPDFSPGSAESLDEDDIRGSTLGGLESLDLHGNRLSLLPEGLPRLERLATLNLSKNRLGNECLDLLGQMSSLRELHLSENLLDGALPGSLRNLKSLQVLDLRDNAITDLTTVLADLVSLRVLVVAGNRLKSIPFESIQSLPLVEFAAARNRLNGILIPQAVKGFPTLKSLDVSSNALTWILENEDTRLPSLQVLNVAENRLVDLPKVSDWTELITLSVGGNKLTVLPEGLSSLQKLCNLDLSCNNLKAIDNEVGRMKSLTNLRVANNPLRERRHLTMATEDIKTELRSRLLPPEPAESVNNDEPLSGNISLEPPSVKTWPITTSGIVDRSSTQLQSVTPGDLEPILLTTPIKSLLLHHNALTEIPLAVALAHNALTTLDLAHNRLSTSSRPYLSSHLSLPHLTTLSLASNVLATLDPLLTSLSAPLLQTLNISNNRLSSLPPLRESFPSLVTILAADNSVEEVEVESVRGLRVLDLTGNEISHLRPELGMLEAEGLREFLVTGNRFRVPRREVVDRGTSAVLAWLREKVVEP